MSMETHSEGRAFPRHIKEAPSPLPPRPAAELQRDFENRGTLPQGNEFHFSGVEGKDVYNITAPFRTKLEGGSDKEIIVIAGRVEGRDAVADSTIMFFEPQGDEWVPVKGAPTFALEDGFISQINGETIFGGVEVYPKLVPGAPNEVGYKTVFYRGHNLGSLKQNQFAKGPEGMKDIRIVSLRGGKIGVFTRPQGERGGKGTIGYFEIDTIDELNDPQRISNARLIENQFAPGEWGGVNEAHELPDGTLGVIGHIAYHNAEGNKHYYAMSFVFDPETFTASPIKIIATIKCFPVGAAKTPLHDDIVFPSSLMLLNNNRAMLYAGLGDARAGRVELPNPFVKEERLQA